MSKNTDKGKAYQLVLSNKKSCAEYGDIFHLNGLVSAFESIMSDRLCALLAGTKNAEYKAELLRNRNGVSFGESCEI